MEYWEVSEAYEFSKIEEVVETKSISYRNSFAFRKALDFIRIADYEEYQALILREYKDMGLDEVCLTEKYGDFI